MDARERKGYCRRFIRVVDEYSSPSRPGQRAIYGQFCGEGRQNRAFGCALFTGWEDAVRIGGKLLGRTSPCGTIEHL